MPFLGIPLAAERLRSADFSTLIDSIIVRLNSWPRRTLSYAGQVELLRSVLQGVECFWLSILPIPFGIIDKIYSVCRLCGTVSIPQSLGLLCVTLRRRVVLVLGISGAGTITC